MKKLVMVLMLSMVSVSAMAEEKVPFVFKPIAVEDQWYGDRGVTVDVADIKKGIFISANGSFKTTFPKTTELTKEIFKAKGLKVVDKIEDADIGIMLGGGNKFGSLESVEIDVDASSELARRGTSMLIQLGFTLATGGFLPPTPPGFSADKDGLADIIFYVVKNPRLNWQNRIKGDDEKMVASQLTFRVNRKWEKSDHFGAMVLAEITDKFIDQHFVGLPTSAAAPVVAPASGVSAATPVVAN